jgi:hypothetical protein
MNDGYALLIGVNDYRTYDPTGAVDLPGSLNDVRTWWNLCRDLGFPSQNIRVLTSPALTSIDLQGAYTGPATQAEILRGVAWLAQQLGVDPNAVGVLTFSGHGDQIGADLVICPADITPSGANLTNAVRLADLQTIVNEYNAAPNLTVSLDCCHSRIEDASGRPPLALRGHGARASSSASVPSISDRMFFAAQVGQPAYQGEFIDGWHGAFTWAFMTTSDQWTIAPEAGHDVVTISYAQMQSRTQALLNALSFGQTPMLSCPPAKQGFPLFGAAPGFTSVNPDGPRIQTQVDPSEFVLTLNWRQNGVIVSGNLAQLVAVGNNIVMLPDGTQLSQDSEYWWVNESVAANLGTAVSINITTTPFQPPPTVNNYTPPTWANQAFYVDEFPGWSRKPPLIGFAGGQSYVFFEGQTPDPGGSGANVNFWVQVAFSTATNPGALMGLAWIVQVSSDPGRSWAISLPSSISTSNGPPRFGTWYGIVQETLNPFTG